MGIPLVDLLSKDNKLFITSRTPRTNKENVVYLQGNAKEKIFFASLMNKKYDAIIDFMVYSTDELKERLPVLLEHTKQYFFFSSARCYADSSTPIREDSSRLVDTCRDTEYLALDEYGVSKGREENLLIESGKTNWTIIRPYITYNSNRIQLGVYEKEHWLKRALEGRTIVFPKDIASKKTSLTYGPDVAGALVEPIGNKRAFGQAFHITTEESHTWNEILDFYCEKIEEITGKKPKVRIVENSSGLMLVWNKWQIKYDRLFNRQFDNSKIEAVIGKYDYKSCFEGLGECLEEFISNPKWLGMSVQYEAWCDRQCNEWTPLCEIPGTRAKLKYLWWRITLPISR